MTTAKDPLSAEEGVVVDNWPIDQETAKTELKKTQAQLQRYQTALRLANSELEQRNQGITTLTTFTYQSGRVTSLPTLLKLSLSQALKIAQASVGAIILIAEDSKALTLGVHQGLTAGLRDILVGRDLENGATILMPHLVSGNGALLEYTSSDDPLEQQLLDINQLTSLVSLPLQMGKKLMGALLVGLQGDSYFSSSELHLLLSISQETALAFENLRLREGLWATTESLLGEAEVELDLNPTAETDSPLAELPATAMPDSERPDVAELLQATATADQEVQQQNADLQTLNAIAEIINRTLDLSTILQAAVAQTKTALQTDAAWLYLLDKQDNLNMRAHVGLSTDYLRGMSRLPLDSGIEGWVATDNKPHMIPSIAEDTRKQKIWMDKENLHALAAVPVTRPDLEEMSDEPHSRVIGVLVVGQRSIEYYDWTEREMRLLTAIANQLAPAIDNARLYAKVREDEAGQRTGNEILRTINDMLLEKNVFLEGFIQDDLRPALTIMNQALQALVNPTETITNDRYKKNTLNLLEVVDHLLTLSQETDIVSTALDTEVGKVVDEKDTNKTHPANQPLRLSSTFPQ